MMKHSLLFYADFCCICGLENMSEMTRIFGMSNKLKVQYFVVEYLMNFGKG